MKLVKYSALIALMAISLSAVLLAKDKNEGSFTVTHSIQVGSTQLKAGSYRATWDGTGPDVEVKFLQGKNVVATAPAKLVDETDRKDSITLDGSSKLVQEIHFGSLQKSLVFSAAVAAQN